MVTPKQITEDAFQRGFREYPRKPTGFYQLGNLCVVDLREMSRDDRTRQIHDWIPPPECSADEFELEVCSLADPVGGTDEDNRLEWSRDTLNTCSDAATGPPDTTYDCWFRKMDAELTDLTQCWESLKEAARSKGKHWRRVFNRPALAFRCCA